MINDKNIKIVSSGCYLPKCISSSEIEINNNIPKGGLKNTMVLKAVIMLHLKQMAVRCVRTI